ncbi:prolipoprotein diacylglyceryl transferase [Erysipelothrix urinaevulpis]|uniref:prolipoprotein diacylglyceryl transferase n=1 Tax=Erysipelothrix urinaevulpis TaxID=2683717 RepID=UPI0013574385|nr:prolipoprotein diacylglyceryl transferase [Erysipelothrix urinaevulpis]
MIKFFPETKIFLEIGPVQIAWYAVLIMTGAYLAYMVSLRNLKKVGYKEDDVESLFFGALLFGFLGARVWYVLFSELGAYLADPIRIFAIWEGGLAIQGGLIAGVAYGYVFTKKRNINFWQWADLIVPNIMIAQAIGRWGNFMNQEAYGNIVSESYYRLFPSWFKEMMFIAGEYRQPTFFFESVGNIIGWILIVFVLKRFSKVKRGDLTFAYMMWYGTIRFFIEGMRTDSLMFFGLRMAQIISILFVVIGVLGYLGFFKKWMNTPRKPVILFDFDGTLMDTESSIKQAFVAVFKKYKPDYTLSDEELQSFIGPTLHDSFAKYFDEDIIDELVDYYRKVNLELHPEFVKPMPHALEVLDELKAEGYRMGIVSNKARVAMNWPLDEFEMRQYFEVILGFGDFELVKPDPSGIDLALDQMSAGRDQLIYVGDTVSDMVAGARAGAFTIAYNFDTISNEDNLNGKPNRDIDDLRVILDILKEDHEWTRTMM